MQLTNDQKAKAIFKSRHESRRLAKRYLKDHGGTGRAEELDAVLSATTQEAEALVAAMLAAREAQSAKAAADSARMAPRREFAALAELAMHAADGDWDWVARNVNVDDSSCWTERRGEAILAYGRSDKDSIAVELDRRDEAGEFDALFADRDALAIAEEIRSAVEQADQDIWERTAEESLRSQAVEGGRWAVMAYYRKTLTPDGNCGAMLEFDDHDLAVAWLLVTHDPETNRTSSYSATIIDQQPDPAEVEDDA